MPPKKKQFKGGLIDPSSVTLSLMKPSTIENLSDPRGPAYNSKNYMNVQPGGGKATKKSEKSTKTKTNKGKRTEKTK